MVKINLKEIKEDLIKLDYPGINSTTTDDDILKIIDPNNRVTFLKWIFLKLDPEEFDDLSEEEIIKKLPELMECHGFCPEEEITSFIDGSLEFDLQLNTIRKTITFVVLCLGGRKRTISISREEMEDKFNSVLKKVNEAFPKLKHIENIVNEELEKSIKKENAALLKELEELEKNKPIDFTLEEIKEPDLDELRNNLNIFQIKCDSIKEDPKNEIFENQPVKVPPGLKQELNNYVKIQENLNTINNFEEKLSSIEVTNNPIKGKVDELIILSKELLE